jgi:hypothetical protein
MQLRVAGATCSRAQPVFTPSPPAYHPTSSRAQAVVFKFANGSTDQSAHRRVFNMLTGLEETIIDNIGIQKFF